MKIALICTEKLPVPPVAGGAVQLYIEGIAPYLSRTHDITVFGIQFPGLPERETINHVKYVRLPGSSGTLYINSLKTALDNSFDLIHVFNRPKYVLGLMERFPDVRFGLSLHNEMFHPEKISDADALRCIDRVDYINTVSKYISDTVTSRFPSAERKLRVVYSGVDCSVYKPVWSTDGLSYRNQLKRKLGLQDHKVVLFVGRLSVKKGVDILLKAVDQVMRSSPKTALVIIGSKWYGKNEEDDYTKALRVISANLTGPIVFTGFIPPAEIPQYFTLGDVFVCASQWMEPLARVHYEAMAAGLPIITTNRGGNAEVVAGFGNGFVIDDYSNPVVMAQKISYLLNNEAEALKMGGSGRRLAEQKYTWERVANDVLQAFAPNVQTALKPAGQSAPPVKATSAVPFDIQADCPVEAQAADQPVNKAVAVKASAQPVNPAMAVKTAAQPANPAMAVNGSAQPANPAMTVKTAARQANPVAGIKAAFQPFSWATANASIQPVNPFAFKSAAQSADPADKAPVKLSSWGTVKATARMSGVVTVMPGQPDRPAFKPGNYTTGWLRKQQ